VSVVAEFLINGYTWVYTGESPDFMQMCERIAEERAKDPYYADAIVTFIENSDSREYYLDPEDASKIRHLFIEPKHTVWHSTPEEAYYFWLGEKGDVAYTN